jgi:transposase
MKSNTQNAKIEAITEKTLVLGIDVGSETHYARAFDYRGIEYSKKPFKFSNTEAGFATFKEWILDLKERHEKDKVVPGMEPTGHYWFNLGKFLQDNEMKPVLVNPHHVKKTKELDDNNPTKNDRKQVDDKLSSTVDGSFTPSFTPPEDSEVVFLRGQVEKLQAELEKEREHNREKDKQLLETLNKLAESQAALSAGQAADKQKALAEKIIEGNKQLSDEALASEKSQHFLRKIFCRKKK